MCETFYFKSKRLHWSLLSCYSICFCIYFCIFVSRHVTFYLIAVPTHSAAVTLVKYCLSCYSKLSSSTLATCPGWRCLATSVLVSYHIYVFIQRKKILAATFLHIIIFLKMVKTLSLACFLSLNELNFNNFWIMNSIQFNNLNKLLYFNMLYL